MRLLRYRGRGKIDHPRDVARIVAAFAAEGFLVSPDDAADAWAQYSDDVWAASWISLPDDGAIFDVLSRYFDGWGPEVAA